MADDEKASVAARDIAAFREKLESDHQKLVALHADRFHEAACQGDIALVKDIATELQQLQHSQVVVGLLRHLKSTDGLKIKVTPLIGAAYNGWLEIVAFLLEKLHADAFDPDENGSLAIHSAAEGNQLEVVQKLIDLRPTLLEAKNRNNETALNRAAYLGHFNIVRYLAEDKLANIDNCNSYGRTPLMDAAIGGFADVVEFLDERGQSVEPTNDHQRSMAVYLATINGNISVVACLLQKWPGLLKVKDVKGDSLLNVAAYSGHLKLVMFLVEVAGAPLEEKGCQGRTPLLTAAFRGYPKIVDYLAKSGAKLDAVDGSEHEAMAIHLAAQFGHLEVARCLLERKPRLIEAKTKQNDTPLHRAVFGCHLEMVEFLVKEHHSPLEVRNNEKFTPLTIAAVQGYLPVVEFLVKEGADIFAWDDTAVPIHRAAYHGHLEVVSVFLTQNPQLLELKAKARDWTILAIAAVTGNAKLVEFLVKEKQANIECADSGYRTPIDLAKLQGHRQVVKCLRDHGAMEYALGSPITLGFKGFMSPFQKLFKSNST